METVQQPARYYHLLESNIKSISEAFIVVVALDVYL